MARRAWGASCVGTFVSILAACASSNPSSPAQGALGGACFPGGTCNAGLVCFGTCVQGDVFGSDAPLVEPDAPPGLPDAALAMQADAPLPDASLLDAPPPVDAPPVVADARMPDARPTAADAQSQPDARPHAPDAAAPADGPTGGVCADLELWGSDAAYLGAASSSTAAPNSVCNPVGLYGSSTGIYSIYNPVGFYGSPTGLWSAYNTLTQTPPYLECVSAGTKLNWVSKNTVLFGPRIDPDLLCLTLAANGY